MDEDGVWDDTALIKAYDAAIKSFKTVSIACGRNLILTLSTLAPNYLGLTFS